MRGYIANIRTILLAHCKKLTPQKVEHFFDTLKLIATLKVPSIGDVVQGVHYRHLIPAPVDRTSVSAWSYKYFWITCQKSIKHRVACEPKLRSVVRSHMHPCPGNWVEIGRAVMYHARGDQAFSAGIKCWHCTLFLYIVFNPYRSKCRCSLYCCI